MKWSELPAGADVSKLSASAEPWGKGGSAELPEPLFRGVLKELDGITRVAWCLCRPGHKTYPEAEACAFARLKQDFPEAESGPSGE
jgi:hypothetical protein